MEKLTNWFLNLSQEKITAMIFILLLLVAVVTVSLVPGGTVVWGMILNLSLFILFLSFFILPCFLGWFWEKMIKAVDKKMDRGEDISWFGHVSIFVVSAFIIAVVWMVLTVHIFTFPWEATWVGLAFGLPRTFETNPWWLAGMEWVFFSVGYGVRLLFV